MIYSCKLYNTCIMVITVYGICTSTVQGLYYLIHCKNVLQLTCTGVNSSGSSVDQNNQHLQL